MKLILLWFVVAFIILGEIGITVLLSYDQHERFVLKGTFPELWQFAYPTIGFTFVRATGGEIDVLLIWKDEYNEDELEYVPIMSALDVTISGIPFFTQAGSMFILNNRNFIFPVKVKSTIFSFSLPLLVFLSAGILLVLSVSGVVHKKIRKGRLPIQSDALHDIL